MAQPGAGGPLLIQMILVTQVMTLPLTLATKPSKELMTDLILYILLKIPCMSKRYPKGLSDMLALEDASYHVNFYKDAWMFVILQVFVGPWVMLIFPLLVIHILVKEFILDGHARRMWEGSETPAAQLDLYCDLITRGAGLILPLIASILVKIGGF